MTNFLQFILPTKDAPKKKSYTWVIREDKVLLKDEVIKLRHFARILMSLGIKNKEFFLVRDWFMIELGLNTGLRVEEMADIKTDDLCIENCHSSIFVSHGKGDKQRAIRISKEFKTTCKQFLKFRKDFGLSNEPSQALLSSRTGQPITKRALQKQFKSCIKQAELPEHYSIHCLRHTFATFLLKASGNLKLVQKQLGHSSIKTTEVYISLIENDTDHSLENMYRFKGKER